MAGGRAVEPRMDLRYPTLSIDEQGGGKGEEGVEGGQGGGNCLFVGEAADDLVVLNIESFAHAGKGFTDEGGVGLPFVLERDDLDATRLVGDVPGGKKGGLVYAVGTPGAADGDDDDLTLVFRVVQGYFVTVDVGEG